SLDPFGARVSELFGAYFEKGYDIRPTIAITRAHLRLPELEEAIEAGRLTVDGAILKQGGSIVVVKAAIEPVWYLPGVAKRFGCAEADLRRTLFEHTAGMFPELVTRSDLEVFLPPIGGLTLYMFGDISSIADPTRPLAARVHDECNGSDVFGSDICTCRPYLTHGIEECIRTAQSGGSGVIAYNRKEGRALGEVTKFLVYNARKRQEGGDRADQYFARTECVAGVQDMRFQELMPDVLHWLGITKIDRFVSMSNMKHDAIVRSGIEIVKRVSLPDALIPEDARVEMDAKMAAGYFTEGAAPDGNELAKPKGRALAE
ncbi:MAG TPA: GTP cyclohydrolase II, partial [Polyangiaceae bacterium]|nr:GTP cyclohydrolase II [Polyangiaceae bacterium]